jgi:hypothetical protein
MVPRSRRAEFKLRQINSMENCQRLQEIKMRSLLSRLTRVGKIFWVTGRVRKYLHGVFLQQQKVGGNLPKIL